MCDDWPGASMNVGVHGPAGCAPVADVALQPERLVGRFSHSPTLCRRRWSSPPVDRIVLMRYPSCSLELVLLTIVRVVLGVLVAIGAFAAIATNVDFEQM